MQASKFQAIAQFTCAAMCVTMSLLFRPKNTPNVKQLCPKAQILTSVQKRDPVKRNNTNVAQGQKWPKD